MKITKTRLREIIAEEIVGIREYRDLPDDPEYAYWIEDPELWNKFLEKAKTPTAVSPEDFKTLNAAKERVDKGQPIGTHHAEEVGNRELYDFAVAVVAAMDKHDPRLSNSEGAKISESTKITKTRLREIIAEEVSSTAYDRDDGGETKTIDSLLDDLGDAAEQLNHDPMASTKPPSAALAAAKLALVGLERFRDEKDEEYGGLLDQVGNAIDQIGSTGLLSGILDDLQKYRLTSWIEEYVVADDSKAWIDLATKMLQTGRWTPETYDKLNKLKGEIRLGKDYPNLTDEEQDLLDLSNPDKNAGPMFERELAEIIRNEVREILAAARK